MKNKWRRRLLPWSLQPPAQLGAPLASRPLQFTSCPKRQTIKIIISRTRTESDDYEAAAGYEGEKVFRIELLAKLAVDGSQQPPATRYLSPWPMRLRIGRSRNNC